MSEFVKNNLSDALVEAARSSEDLAVAYQNVRSALESHNFTIAEENTEKPWGAYWRMVSEQAERFVNSFNFGVTLEEARLGIPDAELSPKILAAAPGQRLSWQYHNRRAERWVFLTPGAYRRSSDDEEGELIYVEAGTVVQFEVGERHRLEGLDGEVVLVAEIWQHTDKNNPSNEADIERVQDDYAR